MFCMLLRKHLGSGKLVAVRQLEMDRVLYLDFETTNELGDTVVMTIAVEIMGRHSNIIVINQEGKILDAIKRVDASMSGVRMILPNLTYTIPPLQDKKNLLVSTNDELIQALNEQPNGELSKMLLRTIQGISPILSREMAFYTTGGTELRRDDLTGQQTARLRQCFDNIRDILTGLLEQSEQELAYIDSVFDTVSRTSTDQEIAEIREELMEQGYLKNTRRNAKHAKPLPPLKYQSTDGFTILCGRNNKQNDRLTLKEAKNYDLWCHTKNIPGSHVIILSDGKEIPDSTINARLF